MKINQLAKLTCLTVRTLHYYDQIGLLNPAEITESGYRLYDETSVERLQQIMFFRELEFPLSQIKKIMDDPGFDKKKALLGQRELLTKQRDRLNKLIRLAQERIDGGNEMDFSAFDKNEIEAYKDEAKARWGSTDAYAQSLEMEKNRKPGDSERIQHDAEEIFAAFARIRDTDPKSPEAERLVERWQTHITENYYNCTKEILKGLGLMYVADERFTANLDRFGRGTAKFMSDSIADYCR